MFLHYLINGTVFENKKNLNIGFMFRDFVQILSEIFFILTRYELSMIENVYRSSCNVSVIFVRFE